MDFSMANIIRQKKLGVLLRDARISAGKYKRDCGDVIGVSSGSITSIEQGRRSPSLPELERLSFFLQVPLSHFWDEDIRSEEPLLEEDENPGIDLALRDHVIGRILRKAREKLDLTFKEVKQKTGITSGRMRRFEEGATPIPLPELEQLCSLYEIEPLDLITSSNRAGKWLLEQNTISNIKHLPVELQQFIGKPINRPYLELAYRLSEMPAENLREIAETLLEITI
jgi:transcriptional regulator with XRE-family HTH domain